LDEKGRRVARALNPMAGSDGELLRVIGSGDYLVNGFRNRDIRSALFGATSDKETCRRQAAKVTRLLRLLRVHGLINKVTKTHRYQLSALGRRVVTAVLTAQAADSAKLADAA